MTRSLILGGTKGLGRSLAIESLTLGITPIVAGRSVEEARKDEALAGADFLAIDLCNLRLKPPSRDGLEPWNISHVFWVAGVFNRKPLAELEKEEIDAMIGTHLSGPVVALAELHWLMKHAHPLADPPRGQPYHLVTIASTSSWRMRENETLYCALKAAKAHFTRNFARELVRDLPGSKATLVNPGGLKTPNFWGDTGQDISKFMEPAEVAKLIWDQVLAQTDPFREIQIIRNDDGSPRLEQGARMPESPF